MTTYRIKALIWEDLEDRSITKTALGWFHVSETDGDWFLHGPRGIYTKSYEEREQAKNAAETFYIERIKQALEEV